MTHPPQLISILLVTNGFLFTSFLPSTHAQNLITPDATMPGETSQVGVDNSLIWKKPTDVITGGAIRDKNLFHSFDKFNIGDGYAAYFHSPNSNIQNILTRVTGNDPSHILGTLGTYGHSQPNLYLINPHGIIFGANSSLNIGGSLIVTTANALAFDQEGFSASQPTAPSPTLTINPSAFLYNQLATQPTNSIYIQGNLNITKDKNLLLIGGNTLSTENSTGNIQIEGNLTVPGGQVQITGLNSQGQIKLNQNNGRLSLTIPENTPRINVSLDKGKNINVISNPGGSISISSHDLEILNGFFLRSGINNASNSITTESGDIIINANGEFRMSGNIEINGRFYPSAIQNFVSSAGIGQGGDIQIQAADISISDAEFTISTFGKGNAGDISFKADKILMDKTQIFGQVASSTAEGNGGKIDIQTQSLTLTNNTQLSVSTFGKGNAGNISFKADKMLMDKIKIFGQVGNTASQVQGGRIDIEGKSLTLTNDTELSFSTLGEGNAGNIFLKADNILINDGSQIFGRVSSQAQGQGGRIDIEAQLLTLANNARFETFTEGKGNAGNITIKADIIKLDNSIINGAVRDLAKGQGGRIDIDTKSLILTNNAQLITSTLGTGNAGSILLTASNLTLNSGKLLSTSTAIGEGGNIDLQVQDLLLLENNSLISTTANGTGNAGNLNIQADFIVAPPVENSDIIANAFAGRGGNIQINTQAIFGTAFRQNLTPESDITASSEFGVNGTVNINTLAVDPTKGVLALPSSVVDVSGLVAQGCTSNSSALGRFVSTGRGGLPPTPSNSLSSDAVWEDVRSADKVSTMIPARGWVISGENEVMLTAQPCKLSSIINREDKNINQAIMSQTKPQNPEDMQVVSTNGDDLATPFVETEELNDLELDSIVGAGNETIDTPQPEPTR
ncbi:S-layer family protein [Cronbergia sp. UHCC 0137]|uniref:S-layer family protein n=1 Tax=Cronbergia sp. UHCC 0137 TaxID=3110239 RepID=UPI002B1F3295|nr:S-layer family protein [Cronbergia sp. UHCC 0137]MEA5620508.1 S-layer family protein [Cronbergia sp. UHCC 0137]